MNKKTSPVVVFAVAILSPNYFCKFHYWASLEKTPKLKISGIAPEIYINLGVYVLIFGVFEDFESVVRILLV